MHFRTSHLIATVSALTLAGFSSADIVSWEANAISQGAGFTETGITSPVAVNIGSYDETTNGGVSYVLVYNAQDVGQASTTLLGVFDSVNTDGDDGAYKLEQGTSSGVFGATAFGVADYSSTTPSIFGTETHVAFIANGTDADLYVNGVFAETIANGSVELTGLIGFGGHWNVDANAFGDPITGEILGAAAFDRALSAQDVAANYAAYVPEPGSIALLGLGGLLIARRRRSN